MVLHLSNFEIPARFTFQPFIAEWHFAWAETLEWVQEPKAIQMAFVPIESDSEKNWLRIRIEIPDVDNLLGLMLGSNPSYNVLVAPGSIPPGILQAHENYSNTPDISGRSFQILICQKPELKDRPWDLMPGEATKNAWIMRDEFLSLSADPEMGWDWSAQQFLNKWGLWGFERGYVEAWDLDSYPALGALFASVTKQRTDKPDFVMVVPHLLKEHQERYRKALLPSNARNWLRTHPMNLSTADEFPFFRVQRSYCDGAIETTITIDHLAKRQFGICKRCHKVFQKETRHKKNYCSERCFNAAGVQRWREKQRELTKKGVKRNAKS
jgi:hypothetical protein